MLLRIALLLYSHAIPPVQDFNLYYPIPQHELTRLVAFWDEFPYIPSTFAPFTSPQYFSQNTKHLIWVNRLNGCGPPYIKHLSIIARSIATRKSNTLLFAQFPFNNLKTFEVKCANLTDLICLVRFLPHTLKTLKNLGITKVDNGVSGPEQPHPGALYVRPLSLDSSERLIIDIGLKVGYYADYLRWWITGISEAENIRWIRIRIAMAFMYLDNAEDRPWRSVWRAFNSVLLDKQSLEHVAVVLKIPSFPKTFLPRKKGIERECRDLIQRGIMRAVLPKKVGLETF